MAEDQLGEARLPDDVAQQVIGYIKHQASKSSADLVALADRGEAYIESTLEGVNDAQANICAEPGEWCICDVLRHVRQSMDGNARIVEALSAGREADLKSIAPVIGSGGETLAELRRGVARSFAHLRAAITAIPEDSALTATARHPFFGDLTCKEWAAFSYVHARDHGDQIEKVKVSEAFLQQ